jgi:hypothetical protein
MVRMSNLEDQSENPVRCCYVEGCTRLYSPFDWYYDHDGEQLLSRKVDSSSSHVCGQHRSRMYLATYNEETGRECWVCPFDCQESRINFATTHSLPEVIAKMTQTT